MSLNDMLSLHSHIGRKRTGCNSEEKIRNGKRWIKWIRSKQLWRGWRICPRKNRERWLKNSKGRVPVQAALRTTHAQKMQRNSSFVRLVKVSCASPKTRAVTVLRARLPASSGWSIAHSVPGHLRKPSDMKMPYGEQKWDNGCRWFVQGLTF